MSAFTRTYLSSSTLALVLLLLWPLAGKAKAMDADAIMRAYQKVHFYSGKDRIIHHTLEIYKKKGKSKRTREFTRVRHKEKDFGINKIFFYFHKPEKVKRLAMIIWKYPNQADDRWSYVPALDLIRRFPAMDERQSFVGSHYTYEDGIGRDVGLDTNTLLREETVAGRDCFVVQSIPKTSDQFAKRLLWIDKELFLPIKKETFDLQGNLWKVFTSEAWKNVRAGENTYPTVTKTRVRDLKSGDFSVVHYNSVTYDQGIDESAFIERNLRNPPPNWIRTGS